MFQLSKKPIANSFSFDLKFGIQLNISQERMG